MRRGDSGDRLEAVKYLALLRGVNLGPTRRVPMAELRELLSESGFDAVATYLQSGNAVFEARGAAQTFASVSSRR